MNVLFDTKTIGSNENNVSEITEQHTFSGQNRAAVITVHQQGTTQQLVTSVTVNGVAATQQVTDTRTFMRQDQWTIFNPDEGEQDVVVTFAGTTTYAVVTISSYSHVRQTNGVIDTFIRESPSANSHKGAIKTVEKGAMTVWALTSSGTFTMSADNADMTELYDTDIGTSSRVSGYRETDTDGRTLSAAFTPSGSNAALISAISLAPTAPSVGVEVNVAANSGAQEAQTNYDFTITPTASRDREMFIGVVPEASTVNNATVTVNGNPTTRVTQDIEIIEIPVSSNHTAVMTVEQSILTNGLNRGLVVAIQQGGVPVGITSITHNGNSFTAQSSATNTTTRSDIYTLADPDIGYHKIIVTFAAVTTARIAFMSLANVNKDEFVDTVYNITDTGTGTNHDLAIAGLGKNNYDGHLLISSIAGAGTSNYTADSGQVEEYDALIGTLYKGAFGYLQSLDASDGDMDWTSASSREYAHAGIIIKPAYFQMNTADDNCIEWFRYSQPPTRECTVDVTLGSSMDSAAYAIVLENCHETDPVYMAASNDVIANLSITMEDIPTGAMVIDLASHNAGTLTVGSGQTEHMNVTTGTPTIPLQSHAGSSEAGSTTQHSDVEMSWTRTGGGTQHGVLVIQPNKRNSIVFS